MSIYIDKIIKKTKISKCLIMTNKIVLNKYTKCPKEIYNNKNIINCSEVFIKKQFHNFVYSIFPRNSNNILLSYTISFIHVLSLIYSIVGLFMNPKYLIFYAVYMTLLLTSLIFNKNNCILSLMINYFSGNNLFPIHLKEITTNTILSMLIIYSLIAYIYPLLSLNSISTKLLKIIYKHSYVISTSAIILFVITYVFFSIFNYYVKKNNTNSN